MNKEEFEAIRAEALWYATEDYEDAVDRGNEDEVKDVARRIEEIKNA